MNDKPDISDELLIKLAGQNAYHQGTICFEQGMIESLSVRGKTIKAQIAGDVPHQVRLNHTQQGLDGSCNCLDSDGIDFCQHCVAVALALRAQQSQPDLKKNAKPAEVLTAYFERQSKESLVNTLVHIIKSDKSLRQEWLIQADNALGRMDKAALRKRITSAIPYKAAIHRYHRVRMYYAAIEKNLKSLQQPLQLLPAAQQIELLDYAYERMNKTAETVDDSGGFRGNTLELLKELYLQAFSQVDWEDDAKATHLLNILFRDEYGFYGAIPNDFRDHISPECLDSFHQQAQQQWDILPVWKGNRWNIDSRYTALLRILQEEPANNNDYARLIELHRKVATDEIDFLRLAEWSIEAQRFDQAQSFLGKVSAKSRYGNNERVNRLQQAILLGTGQPEEALQQQWQSFQSHPDPEKYQTLKTIANKAEDDSDWFTLCVDHLHQLMSQSAFHHEKHTSVNTLGWIYLQEDKKEALWTLIQSESVSHRLLQALAQQSQNNPDRLFQLYQQLVEHQINQRNNDSYLQAIKLLQELQSLLQNHDDQENFQKLLQELRVTHKAKRNFTTWLAEAFFDSNPV